MRIDWLTVIAQLVNFLVLVWLLKRFLYRPVLDAMERRETRIESRLEEARRREAEAAAEEERYRGKTAAFERERERHVEAAREAASREKRRLIEEARDEVDGARKQWREQLHQEQEDFRRALTLGMATAVLDVSSAVLTELADARFEDRVVTVLLRRLEELPAVERDALLAENEPLSVTTAFELTEHARARLQHVFDTPGGLRFSVDPDLGFGIVVRSRSHRLEWSAEGYLDDLATSLDGLLPPDAGHEVRTA